MGRSRTLINEFVFLLFSGIQLLQSPTHTLGAIIRGYKGAVTSRLKEYLGENIWQRNYYEHIIRNEKSYLKIAEYISNNPITWKNDRFFIKNRG
ncbi:hypothetical protein N8E87_04160 [Avibacterium paragallinarum]|uniref:transposase n=1 Tax=Avibacterium paragallinarum TaxID=728 RepID=UPI0021F6C617|nr:transposase [Avibacterium paragallinarum]UXN37669.1 hypothetical protein N8E87_04160 [Avibacterium paragallinarum]